MSSWSPLTVGQMDSTSSGDSFSGVANDDTGPGSWAGFWGADDPPRLTPLLPPERDGVPPEAIPRAPPTGDAASLGNAEGVGAGFSGTGVTEDGNAGTAGAEGVVTDGNDGASLGSDGLENEFPSLRNALGDATGRTPLCSGVCLGVHPAYSLMIHHLHDTSHPGDKKVCPPTRRQVAGSCRLPPLGTGTRIRSKRKR